MCISSFHLDAFKKAGKLSQLGKLSGKANEWNASQKTKQQLTLKQP